MLLHNLQMIDGRMVDISISNGKIEAITTVGENITSQHALDFSADLVFPGLINSHDHLDFNLFPKLGNMIYRNYVEWGNDIHRNNKNTIDQVLKVPVRDRVKYGIYKNLLNGITTVVNHGPRVNTDDAPVTIFQDCHVLHSVQLEKYWYLKLNAPMAKKMPVAIHIGEGSDDDSITEIDRLANWNFTKREIIGIHGIAMNAQQAHSFKALVWCPHSNYFLIGRTAPIDKLKEHTTILFGTDSCVSSDWSIWEHLRLARKTGLASDAEIYNMLTTSAAAVWHISDRGRLEKNFAADIVVARRKDNTTGLGSYFDITPADILLVIHKGNIRLFDAELSGQIGEQIDARSFSKIYVNGSFKYIYGDLPALMDRIRACYPEAVFPFLK